MSASVAVPRPQALPKTLATIAQLSCVATLEAAMVAQQGPYTVGSRYYANLFDAERVRHQAAERQYREALRRLVVLGRITEQGAADAMAIRERVLAGETHCVYCGKPLGAQAVELTSGGHLIHVAPCVRELARVYDEIEAERASRRVREAEAIDDDPRYALTACGRRALAER